MAEENIPSSVASHTLLDIDDHEYEARQKITRSADVWVHTAKRVTEITQKPEWNFAKMKLGEVKAWTRSSAHTSTIKNQLHRAQIFSAPSGKYNLEGRSISEIRAIIDAKIEPRPDATEIAGSKEAYEAALDARQLENTLNRLAERSSAPMKRRYTY